MEDNISTISPIIQRWYDQNKRDLPWRNTHNPYFIWISEVILQQTRVVQGYDYFNRFISRFPDVKTLAEAEENDVLNLWQGLGYYSRARNLHHAAKTILNIYGGVFPKTYKEVLSLKGIGDYTAAAIISFAYNEPYATVDGNVYRVLSRLFGIKTPIDTSKGRSEFAELAQYILDKKNPGKHNQAVMEIGALQCVPVSPNCSICPLNNVCVAYGEDKIANYPMKQGKVKIKNRYLNYLDIRSKGDVLLKKREEGDIWQGLYEFPLIESDKLLESEELLGNTDFRNKIGKKSFLSLKHVTDMKHILSHQRLFVRFYRIEIENIPMNTNYILVKDADLENYPISRLIDKYLNL